jgi:hypothetical protein
MVENNKIKALEEHGRKVDEHIQHLQEITEEHGKKLDQINSHTIGSHNDYVEG